MKLRYSEKAKEDVELAFVWYERQRRGLGFEFLDCVENSVRSIAENPEIYKFAYSQFRRCIIRRFPFSIFYTIENAEVIVHSIFDNRQNPNKRPS